MRVNAWVRKIPGGGHGNPLQDSCLENPRDRGAWRATVHGVAKNRTQLNHLAHSVTQSCPTLRDPMDRSPPGSSVPGILQARILEWVAMPFPRGLTPPRDQAQVSHVDRWIAYHGAAQEALPV